MLKAQDVITKTKILNDRAILTANLTFSADLRKISDYFFDKHKSGIIAIASSSGEKCSILIRSSDPKIFDAGKLFKEIVGLNGGKGGGKAEMAQGTCPPEKIEFILKEINRTIGFN
jgi:alanyl-tRNA synthetase